MTGVKAPLQQAVAQALEALGVDEPLPIEIQETPPNQPGDYGTPVAFRLARLLRKAPPQIAAELAEKMRPPEGVVRVEVAGGYVNFFLDPAWLTPAALQPVAPAPKQGGKVLVEHTSVNPNKELHVGHLRNVALGDAIARILDFAGREVEVLNYIDDTGRQSAESLFALEHYGLVYDGSKKYDHWVGEAYVRLHREMEDEEAKARLEPAIRAVLHRLEAGELRDEIEKLLVAQLETMWGLNAEYDVLVWESDIVREGLLQRALALLEQTPYVSRPTEGKYAGALVMDTSAFIEGMEDPYLVLLRSDGTATYTAKDIAFQFWKMGLLSGLRFRPFTRQPSGRELYTSHPEGEPMPFGGAQETINVIDVRQSYPQQVLRAALEAAGRHDLAEGAYHLAYETVLLEGRPLSGRKGHTVSVDEVLEEAVRRARVVIAEKNPGLENADAVARMVGIGAVRFAMVKTEPKKQIDFRWEQALSFEGDAAPYLQYAHARAASILRKAEAEGLADDEPDFSRATPYEVELAKALLRFEESVQKSAELKTPHVLAQYLLDLAAAWNAYYNAKEDGKPATPVLTAEEGLRGLRLALVAQVKRTVATGLELLGIAAPEAM
ncbi:arginine--tRNA ligase [Oceanithermus sp.]